MLISSGVLPVPACHLVMFNSSTEHLQEMSLVDGQFIHKIFLHTLKATIWLKPSAQVNFLLTGVRITELAGQSHPRHFSYFTNQVNQPPFPRLKDNVQASGPVSSPAFTGWVMSCFFRQRLKDIGSSYSCSAGDGVIIHLKYKPSCHDCTNVCWLLPG